MIRDQFEWNEFAGYLFQSDAENIKSETQFLQKWKIIVWLFRGTHSTWILAILCTR